MSVTPEGGGVEWIVWGVVIVSSFVFDQCPNLIGVFVIIVCVHHYISKNIVWVDVVSGIVNYFLLDSLTDVKDGRFIEIQWRRTVARCPPPVEVWSVSIC